MNNDTSTAEEFWQSKNGGKDSETATKHREYITPIRAVRLMEQYHQSRLSELRERVEADEDIAETISLDNSAHCGLAENIYDRVLSLIDEM